MDQLLSFLLTARGIFYIILFFGGSIFVHELGHFLAAKSRGLKVDRFSIGFGPKIFGWKGKSETEYRISLLPLGGYVSIPQLADMEAIEGKSVSDNRDAAKQLSYTDKVIVFAAGAFFNVLFAVLCAVILWIAKTPTTDGFSSNVVGYVVPTLETRPGVTEPSPAVLAGILPGDEIIEIDGDSVTSFKEMTMKIALGDQRDADGKPFARLKIRRGNEEFFVETSPALVAYNPRSGDHVRTLGIEPITPLIVSDRDGTFTLPEGFKDGDKIYSINLNDGKPAHRLFSLSQFSELLKQSDANPVTITVERKTDAEIDFCDVPLTPQRVPLTRDLGKISFTENGVPLELQLVPVPDDLENFSKSAARNNLVVLKALPKTSAAAKYCIPGAKISGISGSASGIIAITSPTDLKRYFSHAPQDLTLFLDLPSGEQTTVVLANATADIIPGQSAVRAGLPLKSSVKYVRETPWAQIISAADLTFDSIGGLLNPKSDIGVEHLNGIFSIADTYYEISFDLRRVLMLTLIININLAFLNLLPIPVLDGGHILFATIERLRGKPLSKRALSAVQTVFVLLLLGFMVFVLFRDFDRTLGNADLRTTQLIEEHQYFH